MFRERDEKSEDQEEFWVEMTCLQFMAHAE
jgi:hypothetical protein